MGNEEGWVFDVKRFAVHDGPGVRTVVFLKGCSLSCAWCHNPESIDPKPQLAYYPTRCLDCRTCMEVCPNGVHAVGDQGEHVMHRERCTVCDKCADACYAEALVVIGKKMSVGDVVAVLREDRAFYEASGGGITLSGGEPLLQRAFATALLRSCKAEGFHTAVDTSGQVPWSTIQKVLPYTDLVLYDLKHLDPRVHRRHVGSTNRLILDNLRRLSKTGVPIEIRMPVVPTVNDAAELAESIGQFLASLDNISAVRLLSYLRLAGSKYESVGRPNTMPQVDSPSREHLEAIASRMGRDGRLTVVVGG